MDQYHLYKGYIFVEIKNTSYDRIKIPYVQLQINTIADLKQYIIENYNKEQQEYGFNNVDLIDIRYGNINNIMPNDTLLDDSVEVNPEINKYKFVIYNVENKNIDKRVEEINRNDPQFDLRPLVKTLSQFKRSYVLVSYLESNETERKTNLEKGFHMTFPSRKVQKIIPFIILSVLPDTYANIMLFSSMCMNWGFGPSDPQQFYRLNVDGTIDIYFFDQRNNDDQNLTKKNKHKFIKKLINLTCDTLCTSDGRIRWDSNEKECIICNENKIFCVTAPCMHCIMCNDCVGKMNQDNRKCPMCQTNILGPTFKVSDPALIFKR